MEQLLSAWRAAERRLDKLLETGSETTQAVTDIARLRARHQKLFLLATGLL